MIGAVLYLVGKDAKTGELVPNASSCAMCKRMIINAGIEKVIVRDTKNSYREIEVKEWVDNDDSLTGQAGY
jgi:dCMP deaminase